MAVNPLALLGGVGAVALGVVGGLYVTGSGTAEDNTEATWIAASEDKQASGDYADGKYANKYKRFLVGIEPSDEGNKTRSNDAWWKWSFKNRYTPHPTKEEGFKKIESADDLKNACAKAYKGALETSATPTKVQFTDATAGSTAINFKETDVWKFCSQYKTKVTTIKEESENTGSTQTKYGEKTEYKELLVAIGDNKNNWFWDLKQKELKDAEDIATNGSKFKELQAKLKASTPITGNEKKNVREVCKEAYTQDIPGDSTSPNNYPKAEVAKYCSLTGQLS